MTEEKLLTSSSDTSETSIEISPINEKKCYICYSDQDNDEDKLINPCQCRGDLKYVHRSCLNQWRIVGQGDALTHCHHCRQPFELIPIFEEGCCRRSLLAFILYCLIFIVIVNEINVCFFSAMLYFIDKENVIYYKFPIQSIILTYHVAGWILYLITLSLFFLVYRPPRSIQNCYCDPGSIMFMFLFILIFGILIGFYSLINETYRHLKYIKQKMDFYYNIEGYIIKDLDV